MKPVYYDPNGETERGVVRVEYLVVLSDGSAVTVGEQPNGALWVNDADTDEQATEALQLVRGIA